MTNKPDSTPAPEQPSDDTLKARAFDLMVQRDQAQAQLNAILQELARREQERIDGAKTA